MALFQETYINNQKMYRRIDTCHVYPLDRNGDVRNAVAQIEWAYGVLAKPAVTYPNGRDSHEVAGECLDMHEDILLDHLNLVAQ